VNEAVERLMGFKADQFRQVVMLPQGQFQKLLTAPSNERQVILEALFQVQDYGRIEQALKEAAGGVKEQIENARRSRSEVLAAAAVASLEELDQAKVTIEVELAGVREQAATLRAARQAALDRLAAARHDAERLAARDAAVAELRKWEARQEEFAIKEAGYLRSCKAAPLVEIEADVKRRRAEAEDLRKRHEAAARALQQAVERNARAQQALEQQQLLEPQREQGRRRVAELETFSQKVKELSEAESKVRMAEAAVASRTREQATASQGLQRAKTAVVTAAESLKALEATAASAATLTLALKAATDALANRQRIAAHVQHADEAQRRLGAARKKLVTAQRQLDLGRQSLAALQVAWLAGQAAVLARGLSEGEPCPVCGSAHHPNPATLAAAHEVPEQSDVDAERARVEKLNDDCQSLREEQVRAEAESSAARASIAFIENALGERAALSVKVFEHDAGQVAKQLQEAEAAGIEAAGKGERLTLLKQREEAATAALAAADAALAQAQAELKAAQAVAAERQAGVPESLRSLDALDRAHAAAAARVRELASAMDAARESAQKASAAHAAAVASESAAKQSADLAFEHAESRRLEFVAKVKEAGFDDYAAFLAARLTPEQLEAVNEEIRTYRVSLHAAKRRSDETRQAADGIVAPDVPSVEASAQAAEQAVEQNVRREEMLAQRLRQTEAALARLRVLDTDLAALEQQYQLVGQIADVANGRNDYRMTFQRYVLGVFLDEVLRAATLRLRIMSRNRYILQRVTDPATGRSAGGLDLEVYDEWTGSTRSTSTLSGGESFSASLALALGLADVVQSHAGGIRLDTMFIDEGFGTLDPEALDLAIRALRDLQQGGRLVGIISHVTELKEWIDARLEVGLGRRGSTARFVVGG
jgi:exonuclease SbcC